MCHAVELDILVDIPWHNMETGISTITAMQFLLEMYSQPILPSQG